jgi:outer membrane protein OmpA-like peptidoglycan-associated protein
MSQKIIAAVLLSIGVLAGCSTASGPTFNLNEIHSSDGSKAFRIECHGLLEGVNACVKVAQETCGDLPAYKLDTMERLRAPNEESSDPRILTFQCGAAVQAPPPAPVAQVEAPAPAPVAQPVRQMDLSGDANFDLDRATLTPVAMRTLDQFVKAGDDATFRELAVAGYTDSTGPSAYNQKLSERRAQAVMSYLKAHGLRAQSYVARGFGKSDPVASNATAEGRAKNRRVDVRVTAQ